MFSKLLNHLDFNKLEARNMVLSVLGAAPASPILGQTYYDSALNAPRWYDGAAWSNKATDSLLLNGQNAAYYLNRANHTGTQTAATISDLATVVQGYSISTFAAPTVDVAWGGHKITGLADPTNPQDAATKNYVDSQVQQAAAGIDSKPSVRVIATANIALTGTQTIDGVALVAGDRVLCKAQTTASQNGVYVVAAGAWSRAVDADQAGELTPGAFWYVEEGTSNGKTQWRIENTGAITLGTTAITINQFGAAGGYTAGNGISIVGNAIAVNPVANGGISVAVGGVSVDRTVVPNRYSVLIGDGAATSIAVTHNLNTQDVVVSVRDATTNEFVGCKVVANSTTQVTLTFAAAPAANALKVTVIG